MSKKLIAVASAAALALTALVGIAPASASNTFVVTAAGTGANTDDGSSVASALTNRTLEANELSTGDVVTFTVDGDIAGTSFTVSSTGGVKVTDEVTNEDGEALPLSSGKTSLPSTKYGALGGSSVKTFYAYTTSTTPGKVTVTSSTGASKVYFVASELGQTYNIAVTMPTSVPVADEGTSKTGARVYVVATDVFGNAVKELSDASAVSTASGAIEMKAIGATVEVLTEWTYDTKRKALVNDLGVVSSRSGSVAITVELMGEPDLTSVGLPAAKTMAFGTVSVRSLTDQVAALQAQLANTVSKAKYNNLVNKYNKITRGKKAKLVK